jgi:hypothetical protein
MVKSGTHNVPLFLLLAERAETVRAAEDVKSGAVTPPRAQASEQNIVKAWRLIWTVASF